MFSNILRASSAQTLPTLILPRPISVFVLHPFCAVRRLLEECVKHWPAVPELFGPLVCRLDLPEDFRLSGHLGFQPRSHGEEVAYRLRVFFHGAYLFEILRVRPVEGVEHRVRESVGSGGKIDFHAVARAEHQRFRDAPDLHDSVFGERARRLRHPEFAENFGSGRSRGICPPRKGCLR